MAEPTARDVISDELNKREDQYTLWFPDQYETDYKELVGLAREQGWDPDPPAADESAVEYADRLHEDAEAFIVEQRDNDKLDETVLGVTVKVTAELRIDLSTGGPGDYITADLDLSEIEPLDNVRYHFVPWFDHADVRVPKGSALYQLVEHFAAPYSGLSLAEVANLSA